jgi:hypothetical protein
MIGERHVESDLQRKVSRMANRPREAMRLNPRCGLGIFALRQSRRRCLSG